MLGFNEMLYIAFSAQQWANKLNEVTNDYKQECVPSLSLQDTLLHVQFWF